MVRDKGISDFINKIDMLFLVFLVRIGIENKVLFLGEDG